MSIGGISGAGYGCGMPSLTEMRQMMFKRMDTDGDGVISKTEAQTAADTMSKATGLSITADDMMAIFDLNKDGSITQTEQTEASPTWEQHMADLMDAAGMRPKGPPPPPPDASGDSSGLMDQIFAAMDTNGDGVVDQTEYETAIKQIETALSGSTTSDATSSGTTSSTTTASSSDASSDTTSASQLLALIQQLLENMLNHENEKNHYASAGQEDSKSVNAYA